VKYRYHGPETCFLAQFGIPLEQMEPFGWNARPKDILVWHTKTSNAGTAVSVGGQIGYVSKFSYVIPFQGSAHGYVIE
jgi:hypothetical protein